ncbi:hypothetical protein QWJ41_21780, partial [Nocardioides sp. SOB44]
DERQRYLETGSYEPVEETGGAAELVDTPSVGRAASDASVVETEPVEVHDTDGSNQREVPAQRDTSGAHTS